MIAFIRIFENVILESVRYYENMFCITGSVQVKGLAPCFVLCMRTSYVSNGNDDLVSYIGRKIPGEGEKNHRCRKGKRLKNRHTNGSRRQMGGELHMTSLPWKMAVENNQGSPQSTCLCRLLGRSWVLDPCSQPSTEGQVNLCPRVATALLVPRALSPGLSFAKRIMQGA